MIFFITNKQLCNNNEFLVRLRDAAIAGVDYILIREKGADEAALRGIVIEIQQMLTACTTKIIIGHDENIFNEFDEIHLHNSFSNLNENTLTVSTHSLEEVETVKKTTTPYAFIGHIFKTDCKTGMEPKGVKLLSDAIKLTEENSLEMVALGGINKKTVKALTGLGLKHIGIMSEWQKCDDVSELVRYYRNLGY